jgi:hypothetical protein
VVGEPDRSGLTSSAIPLAAGALYEAIGLQIAPAVSALLMSLSSIIVATNAVLLKREGPRLDAISEAVAAVPSLAPTTAAIQAR